MIDNEIKEGKMENSATGTEAKCWVQHTGSSEAPPAQSCGKNGDVLLEACNAAWKDQAMLSRFKPK